MCPSSSRQLIQQGLSLLQVRRVKPFREPLINGRKEVAGFRLLPLLLPQPGEARGGTQLPGFGLLVAGHGEGLLKTGFSFFYFCPLTFDF